MNKAVGWRGCSVSRVPASKLEDLNSILRTCVKSHVGQCLSIIPAQGLEEGMQGKGGGREAAAWSPLISWISQTGEFQVQRETVSKNKTNQTKKRRNMNDEGT